VVVEEVGESFYNPFIPSTISRLQEAGLVEVEEGMLIIKLPHFVIPLIVRKSDGTDVLTFYVLLKGTHTRIHSTLV
jgi:arginyl-tRNA synthetase